MALFDGPIIDTVGRELTPDEIAANSFDRWAKDRAKLDELKAKAQARQVARGSGPPGSGPSATQQAMGAARARGQATAASAVDDIWGPAPKVDADGNPSRVVRPRKDGTVRDPNRITRPPRNQSARSKIGDRITGSRVPLADQKGAIGMLNRAGDAANPGWKGAMARAGANPGVQLAGRGLSGAAAGLATEKLIEEVAPHEQNSLKGQFAKGAMAGGAIGIWGGPKAAAVGALIGGLGNVALGAITGNDDDDKVVTDTDVIGNLRDVAIEHGLPESTMENIEARYNAQLDMQTAMLDDPSDEGAVNDLRKELLTEMEQETSAALEAQFELSAEQDAVTSDPYYVSPERMMEYQMGMQAMIGHFLQPYADEIQQSGNAAADSLQSLAGSSGSLAPIIRNQANLERASATRNAGNLMGSAMVSPFLAAAQTQQSILSQQSQSMVAQAMSQVNSMRQPQTAGPSGLPSIADL